MNNNQNGLQNPQTFFKTFSIVYFALLTSQVLVAAVFFLQTTSRLIYSKPNNGVFLYVVPLFTIMCAFMGLFLYKQQISKLPEKNTLKEKLAGYQGASIIRWSLTNGSSLFSMVVYFLTGNLFFLLLGGLNILYFIYLRPTGDKMTSELNLTYEDKMELGI